MDTVTVSPKFQIVIPRTVRDRIHLRPGTKFQVISFDDRIELVPLRSMKQMKGALRGLNSNFKRDEDDRL